MAEEKRLHKGRPILFFDGVCVLCSAWADFVLRFDKRNRVFLASLQGETAKERLDPHFREGLESFVLYDAGKVSTHSDAFIDALTHMGGIWSIAVLLRLFPRSLRNWVYSWVATNRYKWFGKKETCRLPSPEERGHFLP